MTMQHRLMLACAAFATMCGAAAVAADNAAVPNFGMDAKIGWVAGVPMSDEPIGDAFLPPPGGGPGPVMSDPAHPYIDNQFANRSGKQPSYHVADLTNPILRPWVREEIKRVNERVLAGDGGDTPKGGRWP